jgi:hypothetical protein
VSVARGASECSEGEPARRSLQGRRLGHRHSHGQERAFHLLRVGFKARGGLFAKEVCGGDGSGATERGKHRAVDLQAHSHFTFSRLTCVFHVEKQKMAKGWGELPRVVAVWSGGGPRPLNLVPKRQFARVSRHLQGTYRTCFPNSHAQAGIQCRMSRKSLLHTWGCGAC